MARRRNYGFERRQKDVIRRTRQEAKRERKADRSPGETGPEMGEAPDTGPPPGQWEWFSPSRGRIVTTEARQRPPEEAPNDWVLMTEAGGDDAEAGGASSGGSSS